MKAQILKLIGDLTDNLTEANHHNEAAVFDSLGQAVLDGLIPIDVGTLAVIQFLHDSRDW